MSISSENVSLRQQAAELDGYTFEQSGYGWWIGHTNRERRLYSTIQEALMHVPDYTGNIGQAKSLAKRHGHKLEFYGVNGVKMDGVELDTCMHGRAYAIVRAVVDIPDPPTIDKMLALSASEAIELINSDSVPNGVLIELAAQTKFKTVRKAINDRLATVATEG